MDLTPEDAVKANADIIRYTLADHVFHAIQGWQEIGVAGSLGEIGGYVIEDAAGQQYEVRVTVTPREKR